ncbi:unnamed protein product [Cuscuta campestris]|uniref:CCHC-type domain-containing protein n=1 Tax=Cuscuta campestris TaxID=132261 RepID=A0A484NG05_9ASTE|nr:unnamed protein product [Cuscuta campestris]
MFNAGVTKGQSTTRPPLFDGTNYSYWKERIRIFIQSNDYKLWLIVKNGCGVPMKKVGEVNVPKTEEEFTDEDCKKMELNAKEINMIYCGVNADDYRKISRCETAKQMWEKLEVTYEGIAQVREAKIDHLTHEYELFSMKENEKIEEMFERFSNIINPLNLLGKTYTDRELVRKVLRSLSPKWRSKVDAIEEGRDFQTTTYDALRGNLITYETTQLSKVVEETNKRSIALPATTSTHNNVDDEDDDSDDTDLELFVRKFKKMMLKKGAKKNTPPKCYGCGEVGHIKPMCPKLKNEKDKKAPKKQRAYISWENDGSGSEDSETEEVANLCLMAIEDGDASKEVSDQEPSPNDPLTLNDVVCIVEDLEKEPEEEKTQEQTELPKEWRTLKNHPIDNVIGDLTQGVSTRNYLRNTINHMAFVSQIEPTTVLDAINDEHWSMAMQEELNQFKHNDVWELVPRPNEHSVIGTKWVFRNKLDENESLERIHVDDDEDNTGIYITHSRKLRRYLKRLTKSIERMDWTLQRQHHDMTAFFRGINYVPPPFDSTFLGQNYEGEDEEDNSYAPSSSPDEADFEDAVDGDPMDVEDDEEDDDAEDEDAAA